ncbi:MAG: hypothetical protein M3384_20355 [Acidobacteriota bacterium]|nr:hypothetical protein [Acidobacteriota bacterium]
MRSKAVLSIIAFLLAFGISLAVTPRQSRTSVAPYVKKGCATSETARRITNLLKQDIENGRTRTRRINGFTGGEADYSPQLGRQAYFANYTNATNEYADASASIGDWDLPGDFKAAWRAHMQAWRERADFLKQVREDSLKHRSSSSGDGYAFPRDEYSRQSREISATWYEVLRIARTYNAEIPPEAY